MNFTPADNYKDLRIQACALATLADSLQKQLTESRHDAADLRQKILLTGDAAIQAERATNEQLTAALEALEAKFEEVRADNYRMALEIADLLCERKELRETINSVAVCQKHITEITTGACMICEIEQLREQAAQARRTSQYWKSCHIAGNAEIDKLRSRVAELEGMVPKWVPPKEEIRPPLKVMPMPFWRGYVLCARTLPSAPKEEV